MPRSDARVRVCCLLACGHQTEGGTAVVPVHPAGREGRLRSPSQEGEGSVRGRGEGEPSYGGKIE